MDAISIHPVDLYPSPMFESFFDSACAVFDLFFSQTITDLPDIQYIVSYPGSILSPPFIDQCTRFDQMPQDGTDLNDLN